MLERRPRAGAVNGGAYAALRGSFLENKESAVSQVEGPTEDAEVEAEKNLAVKTPECDELVGGRNFLSMTSLRVATFLASAHKIGKITMSG